MSFEIMQTLIGIGCYFIFIVSIGLWYSKRSNSSPEEYFLGKRGLSPWVAAMSAEASDMSGWLLMGLPGVAYFTGISEAFWTALGLALGTWINWRIVSRRLRSYSQIANNSITLPTFFSNRFHDKRHLLMVVSAVIIILFFSIYVAAQFVTFGKLFDYLLGMKNYYRVMVIVGAAVVFAYTLLGGFLAESTTDTVQGFLMVTVLVLILVFGVAHVGGVSAVIAEVGKFPRFLDILGIAVPLDASGAVTSISKEAQHAVNGIPQFSNGAVFSFLSIVSCMAWGLGYFGMPHVLLRFMAVRKLSELRKTRIIATTWCVVSLTAAVFIGLVGRAYAPSALATVGESETIFLLMTRDFFPPLLAGLVLSGILAASMSSSDSYMLIASSSFANDLVKGLFKKDASDKFVLWIARITMLAITVFGVCIALSGNESIFKIVSYAWAGLGASFGPLILFSLFWKRTTLPAAIAGMISGGAMVIVWKQVISKSGGIYAVYELLPAFILSCAVIFVVSLLTKKPAAEIEREFEEAKQLHT